MKITHLRLRELSGTLVHEGPFWEERLIRPVDIYPEHKAEREEWWMPHRTGDNRSEVHAIFLEIETDEGVTGLAGPVSRDVAYIVDQQFRRLLDGQDPIATERIWDKLYRSAVHGRKGPTMMAISAIDCALWDLRGKWANTSVHRLLGGPVRDAIPAYGSALGYSLEPAKVRERAKAIAAEGFRATKWFPRHGPTDGREGIEKNVELMETLRDAVGPDVDVMLDAWMSWDVPYTLRIADRIVDLDPLWIEEPVMPDKIESCAEIHERSPVATATGEHEYTRWGIKELLDANAADFLQPDTYWAGGITEMVKICALASAYDVPVIPHGHSVPANAQLAATLPPTASPMLEYLIKWNELLQFFFKNPVKPVNGIITIPTGPGMGVEIDDTKIESETELTWGDHAPLKAIEVPEHVADSGTV